jgi:flagellar hook-length control protein FliK
LTIAPVSTAPTTTATSGAGTDGTDPASGDLFALLVAAMLPQANLDPTAAATAPAAGATSTDATAVSAIGGATGAGAAGTGIAATAVDIDAAAAAAIAAGTAGAEGATPQLTASPDAAPVDAVTAATIAAASAPATPGATTVATPVAAQAKPAAPKGGRDTAQPDVHSGDVDIETDQAHPGNGVDPSIRLQRHGAGIDDQGASQDHDADGKQDPPGKGWADAPGRAVSALATSAPGAQAATHRHDDSDSDSDTSVATEPAAAATPSTSVARSVTTTTDKDKADIDGDDLHAAGASPVGVANRAAPLERPAVAAPVAPSTRTADVPAHEQITTAVSTLRQHGDGSYHVSVHLHPADLGPVDLDVQLHHDTIELHMHAEHDHARELLHDHIGDIRHELEQLGLQATTVDVGDGSRRRQSPAFAATTPAFATPLAGDVPAAVAPAAPTLPSTGDAALDVRI